MSKRDKIVADIPMAQPDVHAAHPYRNESSHQRLIEYISPRLQEGFDQRNQLLPRFRAVDQKYTGWIRLDKEDRKRKQKSEQTGRPIAVAQHLPLMATHVDDTRAFLTEIFAPLSDMFHHQGDKQEQKDIMDVVAILNTQSVQSGFFEHINRVNLDVSKYNICGLYVQWDQQFGYTYNAEGNYEVPAEEMTWEGNRIEACDMYNTFWDPQIHPSQNAVLGEYVGFVKKCSSFYLRKKGADGEYYNLEGILSNMNSEVARYYVDPAMENQMDSDESVTLQSGGNFSWNRWAYGHDVGDSRSHEEITIFIHVNPYQLRLVARNAETKATRNRLEIWKFVIIDGRWLVHAKFLNNIHQRLPIELGCIKDDSLGIATKSIAEFLAPFQDFSSFLMNTHVAGTRKNVWDLTVYDSSMIDMSAIPEGEVAAKVPTKAPLADGQRLDNYIWQPNNRVETRQNLQDMQAVMNLVQTFFPTQALPSQVASIDRAVDSQISAVMQGANRVLHNVVRQLDGTIYRGMRFQLFHNVLQYQPSGPIVTPQGKKVNIDRIKLRHTQMMALIGQGVKALDKKIVSQAMERIIFALIQNPQTIVDNRINLLSMMNYWSNLMDMDIDLTAFSMEAEQQTAESNQSEEEVANDASQSTAGGIPPGNV